MNEMIERMAKAVALTHWSDDSRWLLYVPAIKAALKAAREPTEVMIKEGEATLFEHLPDARDWALTLMKEAWQSMIDAALQE